MSKETEGGLDKVKNIEVVIHNTRAEVAKPGQRRSPEAAVPQGFVGSNPTLRTWALFSGFFCP